MTPAQAYEWLAPKLSTQERQVLDVVFSAAGSYDPTPARYLHLDSQGQQLADQSEPIPESRIAAGDKVVTLHLKLG